MKLKLYLTEVNKTIRNLEAADIVITTDFKRAILEEGVKLRDRSKEILEMRSQQVTGKKYWTGKLQQSIIANPLYIKDDMVGISVGPDMRTAPYAEWVEFGHYTGGGFGWGEWWEGYHYMEEAYVEIVPEIPHKIEETLRVSLNKFGRRVWRGNIQTYHLKSGAPVKGLYGVG